MRTRNTRNVESTFGDEFATTKFSVGINGKTFDILLDKMYTNKITSIIRELWTNAYDAHVAAGVADQPFHCQLPTSLNPVFSVRDYGCSMSDDEVTHLYTTVFESSKTTGENANDFVGALGLGSKSPFAYTDAFTVAAIKDGERRTYLASRGADGVPTLTSLTTEPTEEPTGVEVSFPVQAKDFYEFKTATHDVAAGFDVKPTVPGVTFTTDDVKFEGTNWRLIAGREHSIRQGCVIYPLHGMSVDVPTHKGRGLVVDVPIGSVDVAASREALSMDDQTRDNVHKYVAEAVAELLSQVTDFIVAAPDEFAAQQRYQQLAAVVQLPVVLYHGQQLDGVIKFKRLNQTTPQVVLNSKHQALSGRLDFHVSDAPHLRFVVDRTNNKVVRKTTRFRNWRNSQMIRRWVFVLVDPTPQQLAALVRRLHLKPEQLISIASLPDVKIERNPRGTGMIGGVYPLDTTFEYRYTNPKELPKDYYYIEIESIASRSWDLGKLGVIGRARALDWLRDICKLTGTTKPVMLMTAGTVKRFHPTQDFLDMVVHWVETNQAAVLDEARAHSAYSLLDDVDDDIIDDLLSDHSPAASEIDTNTSLHHIVKRVSRQEYGTAVNDGLAIAQATRKRFPMIFNDDQQAIKAYIAMIRNT